MHVGCRGGRQMADTGSVPCSEAPQASPEVSEGGCLAASESDKADELTGSGSVNPSQTPPGEPVGEMPKGLLTEEQRRQIDEHLQSLTFESQHDLELEDGSEDAGIHSLLQASRAFVEPSPASAIDGLEEASIHESLSEMLPSEQARWMQASDITLGPLAGADINFCTAWAAASQSQWSLIRETNLVQPWEEGVFAEIFGGSDEPALPNLKRSIPPLLRSSAVSELEVSESLAKRRRQPVVQAFSAVVRNRAAVAWKEQREAKLDLGVKMWRELVCQWGPCALSDYMTEAGTPAKQCEVLQHVLRGKAPSTIAKRARSMTGLNDFLIKKGETFPCSEASLYQFLKHLEQIGAPKSRISGTLEALNFVRHVMGVLEAEVLLTSRRCKGLGVTEIFKEAKQAPPLKVAEIQQLNRALACHDDLWTRHFAGCVLICCYARCRWADIQHCDELIIDNGSDSSVQYIELKIGLHKTSRLATKRHRFLHAVAPANAIQGNFAKDWLECRTQLGIQDPPSMPFCPAPDVSGKPTVRGLDSDEVTDWLRLLLDKRQGDFQVSSKSLKATVISWGAKRGLEPLVLQRLGYHASGGRDVVYSRDAQAPLLLVVERIIREINEGRFLPDETRGGRLVDVHPSPIVPRFSSPAFEDLSAPVADHENSGEPKVKREREEEVPGSQSVIVVSDDEGSVHLESSSDSSDDGDGFQPVAVVARGEAAPEGFDVWKHVVSGVAHLAPAKHFRNLLSCGRSVGQHQKKSEERTIESGVMPCKFCFRR